jgi:hypothetical protein
MSHTRRADFGIFLYGAAQSAETHDTRPAKHRTDRDNSRRDGDLRKPGATPRWSGT